MDIRTDAGVGAQGMGGIRKDQPGYASRTLLRLRLALTITLRSGRVMGRGTELSRSRGMGGLRGLEQTRGIISVMS